MIKAKTIEEYKVLEFIENNFEMDSISVTCENGFFKVTDENDDSIYFWYEDGKILCDDFPF